MTERKSDAQFSGAIRISLMYLVLGGLWILFSDKAVEVLTPDPDTLTILSILKGWIFIIVTAILLYWLIQQYASALREVDQKRIETIQADITELKQAEKALSESEERFRKVFRSIPVGLAVTRASDGVYIDANNAFSKITGFSLEELRDQTSLELNITTPEQRRAYTQQISEQGFIYNQEMLLKNRSGESRMVLGSMEIIELNNEACVLSTAIDVTERKHAEEALLTSEYNYRSILEQASDGIFIADPGGRYIEVNPSGCEMLGYTREEILAKKMSDLIPPEDLTATPVRMDELRQGKNFLSERRMICKDGSLLPVEISARMLSDGRFQGIVRDITDRKLAEELLRESEERYRLIAENTVDVIWIMDLSTRQFTYVSPSVYKLRGYTVEEVMAQPVAAALTAESNEHINSTLPPRIKAVQAGDESARTHTTEIDQPCKDGSFVQTEVVTNLLTDPSGHVVSVLGVSRDITGRKRAENELKESEERFSKAFYTSPVPQAIVAQETSKIMEINDANCRLFGYSREELVDSITSKLNLWENPIDRQSAVEELQRTGHLLPREANVRVKAGTMCTLIAAIEPISWKGLPCFIVSMNDITERKQAETALRESEQRLQFVLQGSQLGYWDWNLETNEVKRNERWAEMLGYDINDMEFTVKQWIDFIHPDDQAMAQQSIQDHIEGQTPLHRLEYRMRTKDGQYKWILDQAQVVKWDSNQRAIRMSGTHTDITERKQAEAEIRHLNETLEERIVERTAELSDLYNNAPCGYHSINSDGVFVHINQTELNWLGYRLKELIGKVNITSILTLPSVEVFKKNFPVFKETGVLNNLELEFMRKDGSVLPVLLSASAIRDQAGRYMESRTTLVDYTERKRIQEEMLKSKTQLEAANRELESFSYSVSHDLRSPLRGIDGWSLALLEDYGHLLDAHGMSHIQKVREEVQRMGVLIDDILNLSRITRAEMKKTNIDLSAIAETVVTRLQETKPEERQVEFVIQKGLTALGDPKLLDVVLTNLLGNAFKFTGKKQQAHIEFGQTLVESEPAFYVRDNGAGFDMNYANKLFGAFQRMHRASEFPGTGIGLATVQRIITRHGGSVWASSEVNQGSTFYFTLEENNK